MSKKSLTLSNYLEGYSVVQMNCIDIPIATAAGYYDYNNYFYYSFLYSINRIWGVGGEKDLLQRANDMLSKMSLRIEPHFIDSPSSLTAQIKRSIDSDNPILLITSYQHLFYAPDYKDYDIAHGMLVYAYDLHKQTYGVREFATFFVPTEVSKMFRGGLFCKLQLPDEILYNMWKNSNDMPRKGSFQPYHIYSIKRTEGSSNLLNYKCLFEYLIDHLDVGNNKFLLFVQNHDVSNYQENNVDQIFIGIRNQFFGPLIILFESLDKAIKEMFGDSDSEFTNELKTIQEKYMKSRDRMTNILYYNVLKNSQVRNVNDMIPEIKELDVELLSFLRKVIEYDRMSS